MNAIHSQRPQRVLIIRLSALGDVAMTLPVVYSVCKAYPQTDFYMLTRPFFGRLFINRPANLSIIEADLKGSHKGPAGLAKLIRQLWKYGFSAVADLHNVLRSWVITAALRLTGANTAMVDKDRKARRSSNRQKITQKRYIERYRDVFAKLGYEAPLSFTSIFSADNHGQSIEIQHPAVGIAPFARYATKTYPPEAMEQVVKMLCARGLRVYLFGGKGQEAQTLDSWQEKYPGCVSLAGKMPITDELATMSLLDVMVSMDSANQHLASLTGTPVLTIWGSTAPACGFTPFRQPSGNTIMLGLPCQPCSTAGGKECPLKHFDCMRKLSPDTVADRIEKFLFQKDN